MACWVLLAGIGIGVCSCGKGPVAIVNGQKVSARDFYTFAGKGRNGANALTGAILEQMILQAAQKAGVTVSEKEIDQRIEETRESLKEDPGLPSLEELVRSESLTWDDLRWQTRISLLVDRLCTRDVKVTEEQLKSYFEQNRVRTYDKPGRADLHVMVLASQKDAVQVRQQLVQGQPFEKLAAERSLQFQSQQGAVGQVNRESGIIPPTVFDAAYKLNVGDITQPLKDGDKYYLVRLDNKLPAEQADYEKAKERVRRDYLRNNGTPVEIFIMNLKEDAKVRILWDQFADLEKQFAPTPRPTLPTPPSPVGKGEQPKPGAPPAENPSPEKGNAGSATR